jgi:hypothetical protein
MRNSALSPKLSASTPSAHALPASAMSAAPMPGPMIELMLLDADSSAQADWRSEAGTISWISPDAAG